MLPLNQLHPIHTITYPEAIDKLKERAKALAPFQDRFDISIEEQNSVMYSKNPIRVVSYDKDKYIIFDGNGRYWAMLESFGIASDKMIEVEYYHVDNALFDWALRKTLNERNLNPDEKTKNSLKSAS